MAIMGFHPSPHRCALMPSFFLAAAGSPPFTNSIAWPMFQQRCPLCASEANKESQDSTKRDTTLSLTGILLALPCFILSLLPLVLEKQCLHKPSYLSLIIWSSYSFHEGVKADSPQYACPHRLRTWPESLHPDCPNEPNVHIMVMGCHGSTPAGSGNQKSSTMVHTHTHKVPLIRLSH